MAGVRWRRARNQGVSSETPVFILCRDRLEPLTALIDWLERAGLERIVLIDNDSAYEPLLAYYESTPHDVVRLGRNVGKNALWSDRSFERMIGRRPFVYTHPDVVPVAKCPLDAAERFGELLGRHPDVTKVGFGLRIDDLPETYRFREEVVEWESQFWRPEIEVEPGAFRCAIDTTFALYRRWAPNQPPLDAIRTGPPYVARHTTWYVDSDAPTLEERFYAARLERGTAESPGTSTWSGDELPGGLMASLERLRGTA
jgi:hypothetical protein